MDKLVNKKKVVYFDITVLGACDDVVMVPVPGGPGGETHDGRLVTSGQFTHRVELTQVPDTDLQEFLI